MKTARLKHAEVEYNPIHKHGVLDREMFPSISDHTFIASTPVHAWAKATHTYRNRTMIAFEELAHLNVAVLPEPAQQERGLLTD